MTEPERTLGYHVPGDYHFFVRVAGGDRLLGQGSDSDYRDPSALVGLVTGLHEHVHLVQSRTSGYCLWLESTKDEVAELTAHVIAEAGSTGGSPVWHPSEQLPSSWAFMQSALGQAVFASRERDSAERVLDDGSLTGKLLDAESEQTPALRQLFPAEAWMLNALDLLESQAAMAAEWQLHQLALAQPEKFDPKVVDKLAAAFQVPALPKVYGKALRIVTHLFKQLELRYPSATEGPAARISDGQFYPLVIYLLDYALHIPPFPLDMRASFQADTASLQDTLPPFRFILLCLFTALELAKGNRLWTDEDSLYGATADYLAGLINKAHDTVRNPADRSAEDRHRWPKSFYSIGEATSQWLAYAASNSWKSQYGLVNRLDAASLEYRLSHGIQLFLSDPLDIHMSTGLPIIRDTPKGMAAVPFFSSEVTLTGEEALRLGEEIMREYVVGPDWDKPVTDMPTGNPWPFLQQVADRRLDQEGASLFLKGGPVRCPLTVGLGELLPCPVRRLACKEIARIDSLPQEGCRLRRRIDDLPRRG